MRIFSRTEKGGLQSLIVCRAPLKMKQWEKNLSPSFIAFALLFPFFE